MKSFLRYLLAVPVVFAAPHINRRQDNTTVPGKWIVQFNEDALLGTALSIVQGLTGIETNHEYDIGTFKGFSFDGNDAVLDMLQSLDVIKSVEPDRRVYASVPLPLPEAELSDRALVTQSPAIWGLARISHRARGATNYVYDSTAGSGSYIYVVDSGINTAHRDFGGRASMGANFVSGEAATDGNGHGTHCAGTTGSATYGVAKAANIIGVKVLGNDGSGYSSGVIAGISWAVDNARSNGRLSRSVISMSLGGDYDRQSNSAVAQAVSAGMFVAVAAGNDNVDASNSSPASEPSVCTVGATDSSENRASFSNYGRFVDIFAPGVGIQSTWIGSTTAVNTISGTSMATPHIAGLAAYLLALEGARTPAALCSRIQTLSTKNVIVNPGSGSPNYLAYNGNGA